MPPTEEFDYVIVGGGSSGCVLANRLTEDGRNTVLLLENPLVPGGGGVWRVVRPGVSGALVRWMQTASAAGS